MADRSQRGASGERTESGRPSSPAGRRPSSSSGRPPRSELKHVNFGPSNLRRSSKLGIGEQSETEGPHRAGDRARGPPSAPRSSSGVRPAAAAPSAASHSGRPSVESAVARLDRERPHRRAHSHAAASRQAESDTEGGEARRKPPRQAESDTEGGEARQHRGTRHRHHTASSIKPSANSRKAGATAKAMTTWVRVWPSGENGLLQVDKPTLTNGLGIQARDFRVMESQTTRQACCILCRDKCIIVNMSYIRVVVTTQYVLMVPPEDDRSSIFLSRLKERISQPHAMVGKSVQAFLGETLPSKPAPVPSAHPSASQQQQHLQQPGAARSPWSLLQRAGGGPASSSKGVSPLPLLPLPAPQPPPPQPQQELAVPGKQPQKQRQQATKQQQQQLQQLQQQQRQQDEDAANLELPFELKALEICLDELASDVELRTQELELSLKPAIDGLAVSVRSDNLDLLRRLKTRLVNLKSIAQTVCAALEELLEDDDDMFNMSLTAKEQREMDLLQRVSFAISEESEEGYASDGSNSSDHSVKVSQVEMLLEAYFMHFDSMFDRLQDLMDNVTDTEAVVNIKLDAHQNRLLSVDLTAQGLSLINYFALGVFGFFAMNILPPLPLRLHWAGGGVAPPGGGLPDVATFVYIVVPSIVGAYLLFATVLVFLTRRGIMHF